MSARVGDGGDQPPPSHEGNWLHKINSSTCPPPLVLDVYHHPLDDDRRECVSHVEKMEKKSENKKMIFFANITFIPGIRTR